MFVPGKKWQVSEFFLKQALTQRHTESEVRIGCYRRWGCASDGVCGGDLCLLRAGPTALYSGSMIQTRQVSRDRGWRVAMEWCRHRWAPLWLGTTQAHAKFLGPRLRWTLVNRVPSEMHLLWSQPRVDGALVMDLPKSYWQKSTWKYSELDTALTVEKWCLGIPLCFPHASSPPPPPVMALWSHRLRQTLKA